MTDEVKLPIETIRDGYKTTKVCVEDVYKMVNRTQEALDTAYENVREILDSIHKEYNGYEGELIIGTGISQPCLKDAYDEEIGDNIAFMKAKLNANLKKYKILRRILKELAVASMSIIANDIITTLINIDRDLKGIRYYNNDYLEGLEYNLGAEEFIDMFYEEKGIV